MYGSQTPYAESVVLNLPSSGQDVLDLCKGYGLNLDPWQSHVLTNGLRETTLHKWATPTCAVSVPRQAGKTEILIARALAGILLFDERLIVISAHEVRTTLEIFRRMRGYFTDYPDLKAKFKRFHLRAGDEAIELKTGQRIKFMSRSKNAGRGFSADVLLLDEAQELSDETYSALLPTTSASPNKQIWLFGTPPKAHNSGEVFTRTRIDALNGRATGTYYAEWSADPELDYDDLNGWVQAQPALGYRVTGETMQEFRHAMSDDHFSKEILGIWTSNTKCSVIDHDTWLGLVNEESLNEDSAIWLALDVEPSRSTASVSLAQQRNGKTVLALIQRRDGVTWAVDYIAGVCSRRDVKGVAVDTLGPAGSLIEPLNGKQVPVLPMTGRDVTGSCGRFYDAVHEGSIEHLNDPALNAAVGGARKRTVGDSWAWNKKTESTDITPLVSVTYALWATEQKAKTTAVKSSQGISQTMYSFN